MKQVLYLPKQLFVAILTLSLTIGCSKNDDPTPPPMIPDGIRMLVINEGNFGAGTASISGITTQNSVTNNMFRQANNNRPLGDGAQSATLVGEKLYVCVNNSGKIEVMNAGSLQSINTILLDKTNPMYMVVLNDSLAAVSSLYINKLHIINTKTDRVSRIIDLANPAEQMTVVGERLIVSTVTPWIDVVTPRKESLTVIDTKTMTVKSNTEIDPALLFNNGKLCADGGGKVWKLTSNKVIVFDPIKESIVETIDIPATASLGWNSRYDMSADRRFIFVVDGSSNVQRLSLDEKKFMLLFALKDIAAFYNIGITRENTLLVTDAVDYTSGGKAYEYKMDGTLANEFKVGICPQFIYIPR